MQIPYSIYEVFNEPDRSFFGNMSAVFMAEQELKAGVMQRIASDFNQPASTFLWPTGDDRYEIRWFAPDGEIGLCGHGTAAALAYFKHDKNSTSVNLHYKGGELKAAESAEGHISFELASIPLRKEIYKNHQLEEAIGAKVLEHYETENKNLVLVEDENTLRNLSINFYLLAGLEPFGYVITAKGKSSDIACRTLVPKVAQREDFATGSSHAILTPFWTDRLETDKFTSFQYSRRGGAFNCELLPDKRVRLTGKFQKIASGQALI